MRLEKAARESPVQLGEVRGLDAEVAALAPGPKREQARWMLHELRLSLFAPSVKAKGPVSVQRVHKVLDA